jgi:hypothetical protein
VSRSLKPAREVTPILNKRLRRHGFLVGLWLFVNPFCAGAPSSRSGTAPFILDGNRVNAELEFVRPDGTARKTLVFVDLGSPTMILSKNYLENSTSALRNRSPFELGRWRWLWNPGR